MFPDGKVSKNFTVGHQKVYVISDGLGPFVAKELCKRILTSGGAFTLLIDETATSQNRKQLDILILMKMKNLRALDIYSFCSLVVQLH